MKIPAQFNPRAVWHCLIHGRVYQNTDQPWLWLCRTCGRGRRDG